MKLQFPRDHVIFSHRWHGEIVNINYGTLSDAFNPLKFSEILYVNYLREIGEKKHAEVDVEILETGFLNIIDAHEALNKFVVTLKPRWQNTFYSDDYDKRIHKQVMCVETGQIFSSANAAADTLGIAKGNLYNALNFPSTRKTIDGKRWVRTSLPFNVR